MKNENLNSKQEFNPKDFLNALENCKGFTDYQNLGFTLQSLCNILKTALAAEDEYKQLLCYHTPLDIFNCISLISTLLPNDEVWGTFGEKK